MKTTASLEILCKLLTGLFPFKDIRTQKSNYTRKGCEAILEYNGEFYRVNVEHMSEKLAVR